MTAADPPMSRPRPTPPGEPTRPTPPGEPTRPTPPGEPDRRRAWRRWSGRRHWRHWPDLAAALGYLVTALLVTGRLWRDPDGRLSGIDPADQRLFEWMLAHAARSVTHLENPLLSTRMSTPSGLNVMANTSILGLGVPLTPVTLAWGPSVTYVLVITIALAGTATAWYVVLARHVTGSRLGALVGGAFCGFCPGLVSQASGHPQIAAQFLVPLIIAAVARLRHSTRPVRDGMILGCLISYQFFVGEEPLFVTAMVCAVWVLGYLTQRWGARRAWRPFAIGLGVAGAVALVLLAYPLAVQFGGPQTYQHVPYLDRCGADVLSYVAYSPLALGGDPDARLVLARNPAELNTFFGAPLLVLVVILVWWLRRRIVIRLAALVAVVFGLLSLGHDILVDGAYTGTPGPWRVLVHRPLFESIVTSRFGIVVAAAIGVILALAVTELRNTRLPRAERGTRLPRAARGTRLPRAARNTRLAWAARIALAICLAGALLPLVPRPLPAVPAGAVPAALADGAWRAYLRGDEALMPVPPTNDAILAAMSWAASEGLGFRLTHGYFLGPDPRAGHGWAAFATPPTATDRLLTTVARTGQPAPITDPVRAQARTDLRLHRAGLLVMLTGTRNADALRATVDGLVGPGRRDGEIWLWDLAA